MIRSLFLPVALCAVMTACTASNQVARAPSPSASSPSSSSTQAASSRGGSRDDGLVCWAADPRPGSSEISFVDATAEAGLLEPLKGFYGHAAAWGDVNGDAKPDLFVGTFADRPEEEYQMRGAPGPAPDRLLVNGPDGFQVDSGFPELFGRTSGAAFADLDGDADLDLVVSRNTRSSGRGSRLTEILRNESGRFSVVEDSGIPEDLVGRSVAVLDFDRDGLLDLFVAEDRWRGGSSALLRNAGGLRFADATGAAQLPVDVHGLGVAAADLNDDGHQDLFVAGSNRMFISNKDGTFREVDNEVFLWETFGEEDDVSGVSVGDLNRDGRPDIVLGHHYNSTLDFDEQVPVRVYLQTRPTEAGDPHFEDVTEVAGLPGLPTKAPHVEINDFDNDGLPDILTTASASDGTRPVVFRNAGLDDGVPRFVTPGGLGDPQYWITGPSTDVDRDGLLDVLLVEWEPALPSLLFRNETGSGNWLTVSVGPQLGTGVGARVSVYEPGELGRPDGLIGMREITASQGYSSGQAAEAHFGLGPADVVDVRIELPNGETTDLEAVAANHYIRLPNGC
jgi:enediyne biosynthesis protein E4